MKHYEFKGGKFIIRDFQRRKTFSSFLPAVAGVDGKPMWAFYASVGQAMGGFGVTSKGSPIAPFDSANHAYANIPLKGFRTFVRVDGKQLLTPFFRPEESQTLITSKHEVEIESRESGFGMDVAYFTIPHSSYPALVRLVTIENLTNEEHEYEVLDGLPVFFPHGLSNVDYKELVSLMAAYCVVENLDGNAPFVKFKTSTGDNSVVSLSPEGNAFYCLESDSSLAKCFVDPQIVFGSDLTTLSPEGFLSKGKGDFVASTGQTENKLPCAFTYHVYKLKPGEKRAFAAVYAYFGDIAKLKEAVSATSFASILSFRKDNEKLIDELVSPAICHTANPLYDETIAQSYLDNSLRGGFPVKLDDGKAGQTYYVYGRKHGDMERDYNYFNIPAEYYSSGPGNFRDVNQNRRSDLFFAPYVFDYNVHLFFSLIQADGQNPLNVKPKVFHFEEDDVDCLPLPKPIADYVKKHNDFYPGVLYTHLRDNLPKEVADGYFKLVLGVSSQRVAADFSEGYWVDHWTYNVDLLENFLSVYPDRLDELLFGREYRYFYSPVYVEPRSEKHVILPDGKVRQYGAIDLKKLKNECERRHFDIKKTAYLKDEEGNDVTTNLAGKMLNLILVKFSTLDSLQMGIEMECEKPGWNDAMNGLPGLFASGLSESVELLRLVREAIDCFSNASESPIPMMPGQMDLYNGLKKALEGLSEDTRFAYWDEATSLREALRLRYKEMGEKASCSLSSKEVLPLLRKMDQVLVDGLKRAKEAGGGILPSYLIFRAKEYEKTGAKNHLGYEVVKIKEFELETIPPFLEASARALKLGDGIITRDDYEAIKESDLYDKTLHFYKTCADIEDAPFEIGRVHAFTKGWLERECNFLHMDYKYMLGLLRAGYYDLFYAEIKTNFVPFMDPEVYGRNPAEASSFIVPTCNPDSSKHGQGFFARLTGANAEMLDMFVRLFAGEQIFRLEDGELSLSLSPKLSGAFFDKDGKAGFRMFDSLEVTYHNPKRLDLYKGGYSLSYVLDGKKLSAIKGKDALDIREGRCHSLLVEIE